MLSAVLAGRQFTDTNERGKCSNPRFFPSGNWNRSSSKKNFTNRLSTLHVITVTYMHKAFCSSYLSEKILSAVLALRKKLSRTIDGIITVYGCAGAPHLRVTQGFQGLFLLIKWPDYWKCCTIIHCTSPFQRTTVILFCKILLQLFFSLGRMKIGDWWRNRKPDSC